MDGFSRITRHEHSVLVEKCQENGWLKVGDYDWRDDPFLEEHLPSLRVLLHRERRQAIRGAWLR